MSSHTTPTRSQSGFSLIEMMTVVVILTLVMGVVFRQIITVQHRYRGEEAKTDLTQESREFLDQMVRDLHQVGYPKARVFTTGVLLAPAINDQRVAAGLVKYAYNDIWFEGDVDGDGQVDVVRYTLNAPGGTCPCSIRRSQTPKIDGAPFSYTGFSYNTELQNVINSGGSGGAGANGAYSITGTGPGGASNDTLYGALASPYVFRAYNAAGTPVSPTDIVTDPTTLGTIRSIKIIINVLAAQSASDLQTGRRSTVSMTATARIANY